VNIQVLLFLNHGAVCNTHDAGNSQMFDTWTDLYDGINNANILLEKYRSGYYE